MEKCNHSCDDCKHRDKKLTDEPCMICNPWCNKWEARNGGSEDSLRLQQVQTLH